jgi:putative transposase
VTAAGRPPLLIVSDGAAGLIGAIEQVYPKALRQRYVIHRCRNLLAKIPAGMQAEVKDAYWKIFDTKDLKTPPGPKLVEIIGARIGDLATNTRGSTRLRPRSCSPTGKA